nr:N-acetyltransferase [Alkalicoccus halolimnae]
MTSADWPKVKEIYAEGLATKLATFETAVPDWKQWNEKHHSFCRHVIEKGETTAGWAALSPVSPRYVYRGVAEVSIYVRSDMGGMGLGTRLLSHLIEESEAHGIWTLQAVIFSRNMVSRRMHERAGFREVGYREKIASLNGVWHDTILMERRSPAVSEEEQHA